MPCSAANAAARSAERDATATGSAPGTCGKSRTSRAAIRPGPMIPQRTVLMGPSSRPAVGGAARTRRMRRPGRGGGSAAQDLAGRASEAGAVGPGEAAGVAEAPAGRDLDHRGAVLAVGRDQLLVRPL